MLCPWIVCTRIWCPRRIKSRICWRLNKVKLLQRVQIRRTQICSIWVWSCIKTVVNLLLAIHSCQLRICVIWCAILRTKKVDTKEKIARLCWAEFSSFMELVTVSGKIVLLARLLSKLATLPWNSSYRKPRPKTSKSRRRKTRRTKMGDLHPPNLASCTVKRT